MYDDRLRIFKDKLIRISKISSIKINPIVYTFIGLILGIFSIYFIVNSNLIMGLLFWILNRVFDGLDGSTARINNQTSKLGSYLDLVFDFIIYSGIIVGFIYLNLSNPEIIIASSTLLALYYVNSIAWTYYEILKGTNGIESPKFIIEGFETIIFYILFFVLNQYLFWIFIIYGLLIIITIMQRLIFAIRILRHHK